jgi:hypothetical protein
MLKRMEQIHSLKAQDYTSGENEYENFERANIIASWFPDRYKSFAILIGNKLARLGSLLCKEETNNYQPNNESTDDSFLDLSTYCVLFFGFWKSRNHWNTTNVTFTPVKEQPPITTPNYGNLEIFDSCNEHDKYVSSCIDCRKINGLNYK